MPLRDRAASPSRDPLDALVGELEQLDQHFVAFGLEVDRAVLDRPGLAHDEARLVGAGLVQDDDGDPLAIVGDLAGDDAPVPVEQLERVGDAVPERDVAVFGEAGELADMVRVIALAVVDRLGRRFADRNLAEPRLRNAVDLEPKAEISPRILSVPSNHPSSAALQPVTRSEREAKPGAGLAVIARSESDEAIQMPQPPYWIVSPSARNDGNS
jgi:hypothetical protein